MTVAANRGSSRGSSFSGRSGAQTTGTTLTELNSLVRLSSTLADDKLDDRTLEKPMLLHFVMRPGQTDET